MTAFCYKYRTLTQIRHLSQPKSQSKQEESTVARGDHPAKT